jgi:hypothetical protein
MQIVETGAVGDFSGHQAAREIGDAVGEGVPLAVVFFGCGEGGRLDGMALFDEGVEVYHLGMAMKGFHYCCARDACGEGSESGEDCSFGHLGKLM